MSLIFLILLPLLPDVSLLSPTPPIISSITLNSNQDLNKKETLSKERAKKKENPGGRKSKIEEYEALCDEFMDGLEDCQMKDVFQEWLSFRFEIRKPYKTMQAIKRCYQHLCDISYNDPDLALKIVDHSVASEYNGLYPLTNYGPQRSQFGQHNQNPQYQQISQSEELVRSLTADRGAEGKLGAFFGHK